ncbi:MAG: hypothetical protein FWD98_00705 [Defluviitaleaceae bacterium]|nr:hypothetical protein [Defluviitaleaceae bacterium]
MKKLKVFLVALCIVIAMLIINAPDINYGQGLGYGAIRSYYYNHDTQQR